jgi:gluconolactonase
LKKTISVRVQNNVDMRRFVKHVLFMIAGFISFVAAQSPVPQNASVEMIAGGFQFVEGPVWKDGVGLLFSDIPANKVYQWAPGAGVSVFRSPSGNSNGLTFDAQGRLVMTQTGNRRIARIESTGEETVLAATYTGKKLNSPNDVVVKSDGSIFFTDPPFNIPAGQKAELGFSGIYRISPYGSLQLLDASLNEPNGICFSPDETKLYVNNSSERVIYVWDVVNDSTITNKRRFASMNPVGYADGMKIDAAGNVFCSGPLGVWVFSPGGVVLDTIQVPGQTSNCNWGDASRKTLYITSGTAVYRIRLMTTGVEDSAPREGQLDELRGNYPNPFNPATAISYQLSAVSFVTLKVYDILGREVALLVHELRQSGIHNVRWNAAGYPSGVYLLQLTLQKESNKLSRQVNKMILSK